MHSTTYYFIVVILVTRRLKGYIVDLGKYVISRRMRFRPYKVYIFFMRITSRLSVCPYER